MYPYHLVGASEVDPSARSLCEHAVEVSCLLLGIAKPLVRFIAPSDDGIIRMKQPINAYSPPDGREIFIRQGLSPFELVNAVIHECRHCKQWQDRAWRNRAPEIWERDADLFCHEFWGEHSRAGDHAAMMATLAAIRLELVKTEVSRRRVTVEAMYHKPGRNNLSPGRIEFAS